MGVHTVCRSPFLYPKEYGEEERTSRCWAESNRLQSTKRPKPYKDKEVLDPQCFTKIIVSENSEKPTEKGGEKLRRIGA